MPRCPTLHPLVRIPPWPLPSPCPDLSSRARIVATLEPLVLYIEVALIYLVVTRCCRRCKVLLDKLLSRYGGYLGAS